MLQILLASAYCFAQLGLGASANFSGLTFLQMTAPVPIIVPLNNTDLLFSQKTNFSLQNKNFYDSNTTNDEIVDFQKHSGVFEIVERVHFIEKYIGDNEFNNCDKLVDDLDAKINGEYLEITCSKKGNHDLYLTESQMALFGKFLL